MTSPNESPKAFRGGSSRRRADRPIDPLGALQALAHTSLDPIGKTVRLERDSLVDPMLRPMSAKVSVAELYHENSKLFANTAGELLVSRLDADRFRTDFLAMRAAEMARSATLGTAGDPLLLLLAALRDRSDKRLFYSVEIRVIVDEVLLVYEPIDGRLYEVRRLGRGDRLAVQHSLRLFEQSPAEPASAPLVALVGGFMRNEALLGLRGYRRTLLDGGRLAAELLAQGAVVGTILRPSSEFADREVDRVFQADGTEDGTLVLFELLGGG